MVFTLRREECQRLWGAHWYLRVSPDFVWEDFRYPGINNLCTSYSGLEHLPISRFTSLNITVICHDKKALMDIFIFIRNLEKFRSCFCCFLQVTLVRAKVGSQWL